MVSSHAIRIGSSLGSWRTVCQHATPHQAARTILYFPRLSRQHLQGDGVRRTRTTYRPQAKQSEAEECIIGAGWPLSFPSVVPPWTSCLLLVLPDTGVVLAIELDGLRMIGYSQRCHRESRRLRTIETPFIDVPKSDVGWPILIWRAFLRLKSTCLGAARCPVRQDWRCSFDMGWPRTST